MVLPFFIIERAVMIRKLEHETEKLSTQLEKAQEAIQQTKKVSRQAEQAAHAATDKNKFLENELARLLKEKELNDENGDLASQESAKIKHMLLMAESENEKLKKQLATTNVVDIEEIQNQNKQLIIDVQNLTHEIETSKVAKLEIDEEITRSKYQIENAQAENRRLKDEHSELTTERRRLVEERASLGEEFEKKLKIISENERLLEANSSELQILREELNEARIKTKDLSDRLEIAEKVNLRLKEGNHVVQVVLILK